MKYQLVYARYSEEVTEEFESMDELMSYASNLSEYEAGYPLDLIEDGQVILTNRGGFPLDEGTCPLLDKIHEWEESHSSG